MKIPKVFISEFLGVSKAMISKASPNYFLRKLVKELFSGGMEALIERARKIEDERLKLRKTQNQGKRTRVTPCPNINLQFPRFIRETCEEVLMIYKRRNRRGFPDIVDALKYNELI